MRLVGYVVVFAWAFILAAAGFVWLASELGRRLRERRQALRTRVFVSCTEPVLLEKPEQRDVETDVVPEGLGPRIGRRDPSPTQPFSRLKLEEQLLWGEAIAREEHSRQ